jgi:CheY-like chemotaxis protein
MIARAKRILVVEDEELVRSSIRMLLEIDDHQVVEADDGVRALELFKPGEFDLVITDFRMKKMDGGKLTDEIKKMVPSQPVIILTAWPGDLRSSDRQPDAVISKPYTFDDLRGTIAKLLA